MSIDLLLLVMCSLVRRTNHAINELRNHFRQQTFPFIYLVCNLFGVLCKTENDITAMVKIDSTDVAFKSCSSSFDAGANDSNSPLHIHLTANITFCMHAVGICSHWYSIIWPHYPVWLSRIRQCCDQLLAIVVNANISSWHSQ